MESNQSKTGHLLLQSLQFHLLTVPVKASIQPLEIEKTCDELLTGSFMI
jgi:hypothetical protein